MSSVQDTQPATRADLARVEGKVDRLTSMLNAFLEKQTAQPTSARRGSNDSGYTSEARIPKRASPRDTPSKTTYPKSKSITRAPGLLIGKKFDIDLLTDGKDEEPIACTSELDNSCMIFQQTLYLNTAGRMEARNIKYWDVLDSTSKVIARYKHSPVEVALPAEEADCTTPSQNALGPQYEADVQITDVASSIAPSFSGTPTQNALDPQYVGDVQMDDAQNSFVAPSCGTGSQNALSTCSTNVVDLGRSDSSSSNAVSTATEAFMDVDDKEVDMANAPDRLNDEETKPQATTVSCSSASAPPPPVIRDEAPKKQFPSFEEMRQAALRILEEKQQAIEGKLETLKPLFLRRIQQKPTTEFGMQMTVFGKELYETAFKIMKQIKNNDFDMMQSSLSGSLPMWEGIAYKIHTEIAATHLEVEGDSTLVITAEIRLKSTRKLFKGLCRMNWGLLRSTKEISTYLTWGNMMKVAMEEEHKVFRQHAQQDALDAYTRDMNAVQEAVSVKKIVLTRLGIVLVPRRTQEQKAPNLKNPQRKPVHNNHVADISGGAPVTQAGNAGELRARAKAQLREMKALQRGDHDLEHFIVSEAMLDEFIDRVTISQAPQERPAVMPLDMLVKMLEHYLSEFKAGNASFRPKWREQVDAMKFEIFRDRLQIGVSLISSIPPGVRRRYIRKLFEKLCYANKCIVTKFLPGMTFEEMVTEVQQVELGFVNDRAIDFVEQYYAAGNTWDAEQFIKKFLAKKEDIKETALALTAPPQVQIAKIRKRSQDEDHGASKKRRESPSEDDCINE